MQEEGVFDVDANTSIDQFSEDLNVKMPEVHYLFTRNYIFICEKSCRTCNCGLINLVQ